MNSRQIQYAITLSQTLNFSHAADQLGISQPYLSKQILALEKELSIKLFDRNHTPMRLTPAGEYFIRNAQELLYKEEQLRRSIHQFQSGQNGTLTIGITPFRSLYLVTDIVKKVRDANPGVKVTLHEVSSSQLRKDAAEGKFDFAIVNLPVDTSLMDVIPLEPDTLVLAVPNSMRQLLRTPDTEELTTLDFLQAMDLPFVVLGSGQELRQLFDNLCSTAGFVPNIAAEVTGVTTAWSMVRAGVGATLLPLQFIQNSLFDENMTLYKIKNSLYSRQPAIVTRRGQYLSEYAKYAIDLLKERLNADSQSKL